MSLTLSLQKPGQEVQKLSLNLAKGALFRVELSWDSKHDLDVHALAATNNGSGAKVSSFEQVLSTYNCSATNPQGHLKPNADKSFSTPEGMLRHSGDSRTGDNPGVDEMITIDGSKAIPGVNEIPIFVTIHAAAHPAKFAEVKDAVIRIVADGGKVLGEYMLGDEFGGFNAVQMGSLVIGDNGWEYAPVGNGFVGDFNKVLE